MSEDTQVSEEVVEDDRAGGDASIARTISAPWSEKAKHGTWLLAPSRSCNHPIFGATDVHVKFNLSSTWTWYFGEKKLLLRNLSLRQLRARASTLRKWASGRPFQYRQSNGKRKWTQLDMVFVYSYWPIEEVYEDSRKLAKMMRCFNQVLVWRDIPAAIDRQIEQNRKFKKTIEQFFGN